MQGLIEIGFARMLPETESRIRVAGRLQFFQDNWKVVTKDQWVWEMVRGFPIPLTGQPHQGVRPTPHFSAEQQSLLQGEVQALLDKGAIVPVPQQEEGGFYSSLFLIPKKDGKMRPVINLKRLNSWVLTQHFKMEGMHTLQDLLHQDAWLAKLDLKDAYFTVPVRPEHQQYLRFSVLGDNYQFTCLPFGLSCAPWAFTKLLKPVMALLRHRGIKIIIYIDDMLLIADSPAQVSEHVEAVQFVLENLGFVLNVEKSITTPSQKLEFLGLIVDTTTMQVCLPGEKIKQIRAEAVKLRQTSQVRARTMSQFLGKLSAASQAIFPAPLFYRHLQGDLRIALNCNGQNYETLMTISRPAQEELAAWNGRSLLQHTEKITIQSDASQSGWGATSQGVRTGGRGPTKNNKCTSIAWS